VVRVGTARIQDDAQAVGSLRSRQSVTLQPEVAGRVVQIGFEDGARVRRGQLLVQLDDALPRAELSQAQVQLSIAQVTLERNQELVEQNFVAWRVLDESQANLQVAQAQVALTRACGAALPRRLTARWGCAASTWASASRTAPIW
jgi:membrane fusion protein (multidrug efflux system)